MKRHFARYILISLIILVLGVISGTGSKGR